MKEIDDLYNSWWKESPYELKATKGAIKFKVGISWMMSKNAMASIGGAAGVAYGFL